MLADGNVLTKCFGCGVGYPVRTKDGGNGRLDPTLNPRADSFSLYMKTVGEILLKSLLPKRKQGQISSHIEPANQFLKMATYEQFIRDKSLKGKPFNPLVPIMDQNNLILQTKAGAVGQNYFNDQKPKKNKRMTDLQLNQNHCKYCTHPLLSLSQYPHPLSPHLLLP